MRVLTAILGLYGLLTVATRILERAGAVCCGCPDECWCRRPELTAFRYIAPIDHTPLVT